MLITERQRDEVATPTPECPYPRLWKCFDGDATEVEVLSFLYQVIRALKPTLVIETGTYTGIGTAFLAQAVEDNGFGHVQSCDIDRERLLKARARFAGSALENRVELSHESGVSLISRQQGEVGFAFLDSGMDIRVEEARLVLPKLSPRGVIAVHDSNTYHANAGGNGPRFGLVELAKQHNLQIFNFDTPRGLCLLRNNPFKG